MPAPDWMLAWIARELESNEPATIDNMLFFMNALRAVGANQEVLELGAAMLGNVGDMQLDARPLERANIQLLMAQASVARGEIATAQQQILALPSRDQLRLELEQFGSPLAAGDILQDFNLRVDR